jgi:hypothetical protein
LDTVGAIVSEPVPGRTSSGRRDRKSNALNLMFGSKYRNPANRETLMGQEQPLGKAFAILAIMMHGPDLPTEYSQHAERHRIFMAAAPYALSKGDIETVLARTDQEEKKVYYHNLLTTSCRPVSAMMYNDARDFFQRKVFTSPKFNADYKKHLGLGATESVFDA